MQYRNIPYDYSEWTTHAGKKASGYSCEAFGEYPYYITRLTSETEDQMKERIDDFIDHRFEYEARPDVPPFYVEGSDFLTASRLKSISTTKTKIQNMSMLMVRTGGSTQRFHVG